MNLRRQFSDGEKQCGACGKPLPAFESNSQPKYACHREECRRQVYATLIQKLREIEEGEIICGLDGCTRPVPPGVFQARKKRFFCSLSHELKFYKKTEVGKCLCCGEAILDMPYKQGKRRFLNKSHAIRYASQIRMRQTGPFAEPLDRFLLGEGKLLYAKTTWKAARNYYIRFFVWALGQGIASFNQLTPDLITAYMVHEKERGLKTDGYIGHLSTLFAWARTRGLMTIASPITKFHKVRQSTKRARAYSREQVHLLWGALEERGSTMMKAVVAIGLEAGCRISETGNLRLQDLDFSAQTLFVAKSKNGTQRYTHFGEKTLRYLAEWLGQRDPHCGHDFVFYTNTLTPISSSGYLQTKIKEAIVRSKDFPMGVTSFHTHALRHTWATELANNGMDPMTLMSLGGWKSWTSMQIYVRMSPERVQSQYVEARRRSLEDLASATETDTSLADLIAQPAA